MDISKALFLCRSRKKMTKTKLAKLADISVPYLTLLEQGKRDPNMSVIEKICTGLNVPSTIFMFLASDTNELDGISKELAEKLSLTALQLIEVNDADTQVPSSPNS